MVIKDLHYHTNELIRAAEMGEFPAKQLLDELVKAARQPKAEGDSACALFTCIQSLNKDGLNKDVKVSQ